MLLFNEHEQNVTQEFYEKAANAGATVFSIKLRPGMYPEWELWKGYVPGAEYYTFSSVEADELLAELERMV